MAADLVCADLRGRRAVLRVSGEDARAFLQGLVSNDVDALSPTRAVHAALLTPQGKYLFDFLLLDPGDGSPAVLLDAERERAAELRQRLLMYRLRARVAIDEAEPARAVLAVWGPGAAAALGLPEAAGAARAEGGTVAAVDPRLAGLGARVVLPEAEAHTFAARFAPAGAEDYDRHRLALGVPDASRDLVPQRAILLESGFDELGGVSFAKGCFVGQELTARTKHRGLVKKRLLPVRVEGPLPPPGTPVTAAGRDAGEMRSGQGSRGLALLRLEAALPAVRGGPELRAGESVLRPELPGWLVLPPSFAALEPGRDAGEPAER